ncbi:ATPase involved in DNA repair [Methanosarcina siciliae HI350]|uniref:ATPase involved in DNA repair n=1 Tax=Methanosarcina siciliae HI350 TaxID=1434119 RepID=A0A0E3PCX9_9EURY|nr:ATPase involved in DNA repair [Methanosarcina siciliae HI350]
MSLILIIMGVLVTSGCVDSQAQPYTNSQVQPYTKVPGDLYRSIFYPYAGLLTSHPPLNPDVDGPPSLRDATHLLDENIGKAEFIAEKIEPGIQYFKEQGKDVSRLEALLEEYKRLIEEAKIYRALAASESGEDYVISEMNEASEDGMTVESSEKEYLIQSQKSMIQANLVLKDIFDEFKRLMPGSVELNETARLNAEGEGRVTLMGGFDLSLHLQGGEIAIMDLSPDSVMQIEGDYTVEIKDGRQENILIYHIRSADVEISGAQKTLLLIGENITVESEGEGYAVFFGNGTYTVEGAAGTKPEEQWASEVLLVAEMGPDKPERTENKFSPVGMHVQENGRKELY